MTTIENAELAIPAARTAPALSTLILRRPELKRCGTGLASSMFAERVAIVTPDARIPSKTPELDVELVQTVRQWSARLERIGVAPLLALAEFSSEPAPPEGHVLTPLDIAALHETMAAALSGTEVDPSWLLSVVTLARPAPGEPIRAESVLTSRPASEQTQRRLVDALDRWLAPRRPWFAWLIRFHCEVDAQGYWATAGRASADASESEAELLWAPAAGSA